MTGIKVGATKIAAEAGVPVSLEPEDGTDVFVPISGTSSAPPMTTVKPGNSGAVVNRAALIAERESLAGSSSGFAASRRRAIAEALGETTNSNSFGFGD